MPSIYNRDSLRANVEAATGGKITVLYTAKGQPSYMHVVSAFNADDVEPGLAAGLHPMFMTNGQAKTERFIGAYPGVVRNGELISLPGEDPAASANFDTFLAQARANGPGWGLMTNMDWSGLGLWCRKNGFVPRGNTNYGKSSDAPWETGVRGDGGLPGNTSGIARTQAGSGPTSWRHDNTHAGIADLVGNVWEWSPGLRLVDGEIQVIADNNAASSTIDLSAASSEWRAIDGATGALVTPGSANTVKIASSGTAAYTLVASSGGAFQSMTNPGTTPVAEAALKVLKLHGIYPVGADLGGDGIWFTLDGERVPYRGGVWNYGERAGVFAVNLYYARSNVNASIGARPAFSL
ncbi:hypothetical protein PU634_05270 [Oceanimonas pelagia]|uniref:Sulfatase-modifying factor enzyme domain-containing protein n=1 Tax=Oceanimonas pelagia TaxID=3028314 RepID=A0AA50KQJ1_9GAMM|nr:hypothetical protein [Oceanimonas pelagia]WMC11779.1 hypothetical protein PU634_05270 [Oceanimonas pelagia]